MAFRLHNYGRFARSSSFHSCVNLGEEWSGGGSGGGGGLVLVFSPRAEGPACVSKRASEQGRERIHDCEFPPAPPFNSALNLESGAFLSVRRGETLCALALAHSQRQLYRRWASQPLQLK